MGIPQPPDIEEDVDDESDNDDYSDDELMSDVYDSDESQNSMRKGRRINDYVAYDGTRQRSIMDLHRGFFLELSATCLN
nr:hypothetical protein [Tanacetum cinerariifolium]